MSRQRPLYPLARLSLSWNKLSQHTRTSAIRTCAPLPSSPCRTSMSSLILPTCTRELTTSVEMRSKVLSPLHILRRHLDTLLSNLIPRPASASPASGFGISLTDPFPGQPVRGWNSLYEMVTFRPDIGYAAALEREKWQGRVVERVAWGLGVGTVGVAGVAASWGYRMWARRA